MLVPTPKTWDDDVHPTSDDMNAELRDPLKFLINPPSVCLGRTAAQDIPNNTTTPIIWDEEIYDTDNTHSNTVDNTKIIVNTPGVYLITARIAYNLEITSGLRYLGLQKNGVSFYVQSKTQDGYTRMNTAILVECNQSDYIQMTALQTSGGTVSVRSVEYDVGIEATWVAKLGMLGEPLEVPAPLTWSAGNNPTSAMLNSEVRDALNFLLCPPRASLTKSANQTVNASTYTPITFDQEEYDTDDMHELDSNNARLTIKTPGIYLVIARIAYNAEYTDGSRYLTISLNDAAVYLQSKVRDHYTRMTGAAFVECRVGDYIELEANHTASGSISVRYPANETGLQAIWVSVL